MEHCSRTMEHCSRTKTWTLHGTQKEETMQTPDNPHCCCDQINSIEHWNESRTQLNYNCHKKLNSRPTLSMRTKLRNSYRSNMPLSTMWSIFILHCACSIVASAHGFDPNFQTYKDNLKARDFEEIHHSSGDNLHLLAVTEHLFNRSIAEDLKRFDSAVISEGDAVSVYFPTSLVPGSQWMMFRQDSGLLQGIPLPEHEGVNNIYVTVINAKTHSRLTLPCVIEVFSRDVAVELDEKLKNHPRLKINAPRSCPHHETQTVATLTLNTQPSAFSKENRVECIQRLSSFLNIPCEDVTFHTSPESMKYDRPFLTGPGNTPKVRTHRGDRDITTPVILSWSLGCSSDIINDIPGLDKLETSAIDGSLARAIGYDVTEWQMVNRIHRPKQLHRRKRRTGDVPASASILYPRASRMADNRRKGMPGLESEEVGADLQNGKTKVAVNMVRSTPAPSIPIRASVITPPLDRLSHTLPPSTPSITVPKTSVTPEHENQDNSAPMILFGMENLHAIEGTYMEFRIPADSFYDDEEGMAWNLQLQIMDLTTAKFLENNGKWPMFDSASQLLYGVPGSNVAKEKEYMLAAEDSGGKSGSLPFTIYLEKNKQKPRSHKYTFLFSESPKSDEKDVETLYSYFGRKLSVALAKTESMPGTLAMVKIGLTRNGELYVTWFDRLHNDGTTCRSEQIKQQANLMIGSDAAPGRNKPAREFAAKFKPEFKLKSIKIELIGPCATHTTTTLQTTTTSTTTTAPITTTSTQEPAIVSLTTTSTTVPITTSTTSTTTMGIKTPILKTESPSPPKFVKPIFQLSAEVGKVTEFIIPEDVLIDTQNSDDVILSLPGNAPAWLGINAKTQTLCSIPTQYEFDGLKEYNTTHRMWKGMLLAENKGGVDSTSAQLEVYIKNGMKLDDMKANHKFQIRIKNYEMSNFTASDRARLIKLIADITGDKDESSIYIRPIQEGSIVFTWHNSTLAYSNPCPFKDIAMLGGKFFNGDTFDPKVRNRFIENNFTVTAVNLSRPKWCKMMLDPPTTIVNVAIAGTQGKSTTIIIIAVVVICLVLLIVILVLKCKMGKKTRAKKEEEEEKLKREEAAIAAANPDILETPRIKKGVPIIFQDEIGMESNGNAHVSPATPLIVNHRGNGDARTFAVTDHDDDIHEETTFNTPLTRHPMTPPTPVMSGRPPPPYTKSR